MPESIVALSSTFNTLVEKEALHSYQHSRPWHDHIKVKEKNVYTESVAGESFR